MFRLLCLALLSTALGHQCGVGENWQPTIHKYSHKDRQLMVQGLQRGDTFVPIRLHFEYLDLGMTDEQEDIFKNQVMPSVEHWFTSVLEVYPLTENLVITVSDCNGATVPADHQSTGVPDTDFVVYITGSAQGNGFVGTGGACLQDSAGNNNPLAGSYSVNTDQFFLDGITLAQQVAISIHELTHALVFSSGLFNDFVDSNGDPYSEVTKTSTVDARGKTVTLLTTPNVVSYTKQIFGCDAVEGLELEDYGGSGVAGSHWEAKIVKEDYMVEMLPQYPSLSALTLAVFQDSGWYKANFDRAQPIIWGRDLGCDWLNNKCISGDDPQRGYCTDNSADTCDVYLLGVGKCNIYTYDEDLAAEDQYFDDPKKGGSIPYPDYCPYVQTYSNKICTDPNSLSEAFYGETLGASSRCIVSTLVMTDSGYVVTDPSPLCYEVHCDTDGNQNVIIGTETVVCTAGASITVPGYDGVLTCPDNLCMVVPCPDFCFGQGVCNNGVCECDDGFGGNNCQNICVDDCKNCDGTDPSLCTACYDTATLGDRKCTCPSGSEFDAENRVCVETATGCADSCKECATSTTCKSCYDGSTLDDGDGSCKCNDSEKTFNSDTKACEYTCDVSCNGCASNTKCSDCYDTATLDADGKCDCPSGSEFDEENKVCVEIATGCADSCKECATSTTCKSCYDGSTLDDGDGSCKCNDSEKTFNPDTKTCEYTCDVSCNGCASNTECSDCYDTATLDDGNGKCSCPSGSEFDAENKICVVIECADSCKECATSTTCKSCYDGSTLDDGDGSCKCNDSEKTFNPDTKTCEYTCDASCNGCASNTECSGCYDTATPDGNGKCACPSGSEFDEENKVCVEIVAGCDDSCKECATSTTCKSCYDGSTLDENDGSCKCDDSEKTFNLDTKTCEYTCDASCKGCASNTECSDCYDTAVKQDDGTCECPSASVWNSDGKTCDPCADGCDACSSASVCTQCSDENASPVEGVCECNPKFYHSESTCIACGDHAKECDENGAISCDEEFFLYKGEDKTTCECKNYVACAETCNTCNADPQCYQCGLMGASSGASCVDVSVGYKVRFSNGRLTITFAKDLEKTLSKKEFQVTKDGQPLDSSSWELTKVSDSEYTIDTDLTKSSLPVSVILDFDQD